MRDFTTATQIPSYIPYPRFLLQYSLSETARLVYCLILSRILLSQTRGWVDEENHVYCRYTIQSLMDDAGKSKTAILNAMGILESNGLLIRCRTGSGYSNRLYLRLPDTCTSDDQISEPQRYRKQHPSNYKSNTKNKLLNYDYTGDSL